jgi:hypothetical protein
MQIKDDRPGSCIPAESSRDLGRSAGVALKPSCVAQTAIAHINRHLRPRTIHIITTSERKCSMFRRWAANIRCHLEGQLLPGLTRDAVHQRFGAGGDRAFKGRTLAGWYLQQVRPRAAASAARASRHMVPLPGCLGHLAAGMGTL